MKFLAPIAGLSLALMLVACGEDRSTTSTAVEEPKLTKPKVEVPAGRPPKQLVTDDLETGSGPVAKDGDEVSVQYVGVEYENGKQIDASWDRGEPFAFQLGGGGVIDGWEEGVPGMKVGGRRQLVIPPDLAYGTGTLVFVIDLLSIEAPGSGQGSNAADGPEQPAVQVPDGPPPTELRVIDLEEGTGPEAKAGSEILVDYVGVNYRTGQEFEATYGSRPVTYKLGRGEVIDGWERGLKGMKEGGRRELTIPSKLAYGTGTVIYVVDLLEVK